MPITPAENAVSADAEPPTEDPGQEPSPKKTRRRRLAGLRSRLLVAIPGIVIAIAVVVLGGPIFAAAIAILATLGLYEFYSLTAASRPLRWAGYLGVLSIVGLAASLASPERGVLLGMVASLGLVAAAGFALKRRDDLLTRMSATIFGVLYIGVPMGLLVAMRDLDNGTGVIVNVLVGTWVFDSASYFGGRQWGKTPIAPRTSPNKTVEGFVIGLVVGVFAVWVAGLYMDWISAPESLLIGLVTCIGAYFGDLFESMIKRDVGAKDAGKLLLGHGGVLDRFDALLFSAPVVYFVTVFAL